MDYFLLVRNWHFKKEPPFRNYNLEGAGTKKVCSSCTYSTPTGCESRRSATVVHGSSVVYTRLPFELDNRELILIAFSFMGYLCKDELRRKPKKGGNPEGSPQNLSTPEHLSLQLYSNNSNRRLFFLLTFGALLGTRMTFVPPLTHAKLILLRLPKPGSLQR